METMESWGGHHPIPYKEIVRHGYTIPVPAFRRIQCPKTIRPAFIYTSKKERMCMYLCSSNYRHVFVAAFVASCRTFVFLGDSLIGKPSISQNTIPINDGSERNSGYSRRHSGWHSHRVCAVALLLALFSESRV